MNITVIGASGSIGSEVARQIVSTRLLENNERLQLVGRSEGASHRTLYGLSTDLMDAYDEICPTIEVVLNAEDISGDLIIMAAGMSAPVNKPFQNISRDSLAKKNRAVFEYYASSLGRCGKGSEIVICISNPNELAVEIFARHLDRKRVIGIGSYLDSLRFRKEIANDINLRRQKVHAFMIGEHGRNMVPIWSNVHIHGKTKDILDDIIKKIRMGYSTINLAADITRARSEIDKFIFDGKIIEAFKSADMYPPDIRVVLKSDITHFSGSKTITGAANATLELIKTITQGHDAFISGQIKLEGEFYGICGTIGVPFMIGNSGVENVLEIPLNPEENELLMKSAENINRKICEWVSSV